MIKLDQRTSYLNSMVSRNGVSLDQRDCLTRIQLIRSRLPASTRRVADMLCTSPAEHVGRSSSELARQSRVSGACVAGLVHSLGYSSYAEFSSALSASVLNHTEEVPTSDHNEDRSEVVRKTFESMSRALAELSKTIETGILEKAVEAVIAANRIYCYAIGSSGLLASEAEHCFVRLGLNCVSIQSWMQLAVQTSLLSSKDVVLAFSHTGRNRRTVEGLELARRTGATTISITGQPDSPLTKASDIALVLSHRNGSHRNGSSPEVFPNSKIPELALVYALANCVSVLSEKPTREPNQCDKHVEMMLM